MGRGKCIIIYFSLLERNQIAYTEVYRDQRVTSYAELIEEYRQR